MKTKKTIIQLLVLSGIAVSLSACGQSNYKSSRVPTNGAPGISASPLQGYWISTCGGLSGINTQQSVEFNGNTYIQYQDTFSSSDCSDPTPISTVMVSGSYAMVSQNGQGMPNAIEFTPTSGNGQELIYPLNGYQQYSLTGNTLLFISMDQTGYTNLNSPTYTLYTGN